MALVLRWPSRFELDFLRRPLPTAMAFSRSRSCRWHSSLSTLIEKTKDEKRRDAAIGAINVSSQAHSSWRKIWKSMDGNSGKVAKWCVWGRDLLAACLDHVGEGRERLVDGRAFLEPRARRARFRLPLGPRQVDEVDVRHLDVGFLGAALAADPGHLAAAAAAAAAGRGADAVGARRFRPVETIRTKHTLRTRTVRDPRAIAHSCV